MTQRPDKPFSGIFISYRREDAAGHAGRLYDRLSAHFGGAQVFMDIDHIEPGEDFVRVIEDAVGSCEVLLAMIGRDWLDSTDAAGRRLDNPNDFVRLEIAAALNRGVRVIPLLVQGAQMPKPADLPEDLSGLSRRHALELSDVRWRHDVTQLIGRVERILEDCRRERLAPSATTPPITPPADVDEPKPADDQPAVTRRRLPTTPMLLVAAGALVLVGALALVLFGGPGDVTNENTAASNENAASNTNKAGGGGALDIPPPPGMVYFPGGEFTMGRADGDEYERPPHRVSLKPFFIDEHEVTCGEYKDFVDATGHPPPEGWKDKTYPRGERFRPVTNVTWKDAAGYCAHEGKRLPGEAEWEFAARYPDGRLYPWGNEWRSGMANANEESNSLADFRTWPKNAPPFKLHDMSGNAWEWTADAVKAYPGGVLPPQFEDDIRVIRGGSFKEPPQQVTATFRGVIPAGDSYPRLGFRCAKDAPPPGQ